MREIVKFSLDYEKLIIFSTIGCNNQADKRRINLEAYLVSQPVSTLQLVNPFSFITGLAVIACLLIIILFTIIFIVLQVSVLLAKNNFLN